MAAAFVRIINTFTGKTKGVTICADEILNYDSKKSRLDEAQRAPQAEFPEE